MHDATEFAKIASQTTGNVHVIDGAGMRVNAKSVLGMLYALEFNELWCESEFDIYTYIQKFVC